VFQNHDGHALLEESFFSNIILAKKKLVQIDVRQRCVELWIRHKGGLPPFVLF